jgi:hypothetical protein
MALWAIFAGDAVAHRTWMIRGFSVMWCSVVLFRLGIIFVIPAVAELPQGYGPPYTAFIFLSWAVGLLLGDIYLFATRNHPRVLALASAKAPKPAEVATESATA